MTRRKKKKRQLLAPAQELFNKISNTDARVRRTVIKYGLIALGLFFLYSFMSGNYGVIRILKLELEHKALVESNRQLTAELIDAVRVREMLKHDKYYIEYIARTRYHMAYPNETIYRFQGQ